MSQEGLNNLDDFGHKHTIIPAEVKGYYQERRFWFQWILIFIFLLAPWIYINGSQLILLNLPERKFAFFGYTFLAHDGPLVFLILAILTLGLAAMTAVFGRVWCGWGCPQTVFIERIYRAIEILVEGKYIQRRKLAAQEMNAEKFFKTVIKWFLYLVVSSLIAHSFVAYFSGSKELTEMVLSTHPQDHWTYFLIITAMTAVLLFDFGWFREQFCIIMCPYGRIQSVLMDKDSLAIMYNEKRSDCIECKRCVQVCPTGIDIRKGLQMECIACTACADACDEIMTKVNRPQKLIGYNSISEKGIKWFKPRVLVYGLIIIVCAVVLTVNVAHRNPFYVSLLRAKDIPYQILNEGQVLNHLKLHILNQTKVGQEFEVKISEAFKDIGIIVTVPNQTIVTAAGAESTVHFFVMFPKQILVRGALPVNFQIKEIHSGTIEQKALSLSGPIDSI